MRKLPWFICLAVSLGGSDAAQAAVTTWTVQSASSKLTLSGSIASGGSFLSNFGQQGSTSLVTSYSGSITTQQTFLESSKNIEFLSASIIASNSGNWDPMPGGSTGLAPANYGMHWDFFIYRINAVLRDLDLNLTSGPLSLTESGYFQSFSDPIGVTIQSGSLAFRGLGDYAGMFGEGSATFSGTTSSLSAGGIMTNGPLITTLAIPVDFELRAVVLGADTTNAADDFTMNLNLSGNIVATAPTESVPEANSLPLLGLAGSVVGFMGYRRKRRHQVTVN